MQFSMDSRQKHATVSTPLCLEDGKRYQIKLKMDQYDPNSPDPKASILIDSVSKNIGLINIELPVLVCEARLVLEWETVPSIVLSMAANLKVV